MALLVALLTTLAGCGGEVSGSAKLHSDSGVTATATSAASPPVAPNIAHQDSKEGAKAAAKYWLDVFYYSLVTGDDKELRKLNLPSCHGCTRTAEHIEGIYKTGAHIVGNPFRITDLSLDFFTKADTAVVTLTFDADTLTTVAKNGTRSIHSKAQTKRFQFALKWANSGWIITDAGDVSDEAH